MKRTFALVCTLALALLWSGRALAAGEVKEACKDDAAKFCKKVAPGKGRVLSCLYGAKDKVSEGCKKAVVEKKDAVKKFLADCKADLVANCRKVPAGKGRKVACLKGAQDKLKPPCKEHFEKNTAADEDEED